MFVALRSHFTALTILCLVLPVHQYQLSKGDITSEELHLYIKTGSSNPSLNLSKNSVYQRMLRLPLKSEICAGYLREKHNYSSHFRYAGYLQNV